MKLTLFSSCCVIIALLMSTTLMEITGAERDADTSAEEADNLQHYLTKDDGYEADENDGDIENVPDSHEAMNRGSSGENGDGEDGDGVGGELLPRRRRKKRQQNNVNDDDKEVKTMKKKREAQHSRVHRSDETQLYANNDTVNISSSSSSAEMGPPDSHEAMNHNRQDVNVNANANANKEEKLEISSGMLTGKNREKRSYEFLIGLVNNNSRYEITNVEERTTEATIVPNTSEAVKKMEASDLLLELLVKISAHPDQWENVHNFLQKLDSDLETSRKIMDKVYNNKSGIDSKNLKIEQKKSDDVLTKVPSSGFNVNYNKEFIDPPKGNSEIQIQTKPNRNVDDEDVDVDGDVKDEEEEQEKRRRETQKAYEMLRDNAKSRNLGKEFQKMVVVLNAGEKGTSSTERSTTGGLVPNQSTTNKWPVFDASDVLASKKDGGLEKNINHNFAYHRVTGQPYSLNQNPRNPKAYIAVSVIAPKPLKEDQELELENELRQLKPWQENHQAPLLQTNARWRHFNEPPYAT